MCIKRAGEDHSGILNYHWQVTMIFIPTTYLPTLKSKVKVVKWFKISNMFLDIEYVPKYSF